MAGFKVVEHFYGVQLVLDEGNLFPGLLQVQFEVANMLF